MNLIFIINLYFSLLRINKIKIFLTILNFIIISIVIFIKYDYKEDFPKFYYDQVNSSYPGAKNLKLNFYKRNCRKIFKYKPNNKKDLVILAYEFQNKSLEHNLFMER